MKVAFCCVRCGASVSALSCGRCGFDRVTARVRTLDPEERARLDLPAPPKARPKFDPHRRPPGERRFPDPRDREAISTQARNPRQARARR